MQIRCSQCNAPMTCAPGQCWCDEFPPLPVTDPKRGCYCPNCLKTLLEPREPATATPASTEAS